MVLDCAYQCLCFCSSLYQSLLSHGRVSHSATRASDALSWMSGMGMCVGVWLSPIPVVIPPVQAGWVAPNQCLERRMMADGWRNSVLHSLCFLNTKQIWSKWSFCELGGFAVSHACCSVLARGASAIQGDGGHANSLFLEVFWESDLGNKQVLIQTAFLQKSKLFPFCKQYQIYYFVPKDPLHMLFRIFYLGLVAVCSPLIV